MIRVTMIFDLDTKWMSFYKQVPIIKYYFLAVYLWLNTKFES